MKRLIYLGVMLAALTIGLAGCSLGTPVPSASPPATGAGSGSGLPYSGTAPTPGSNTGDLGPVVATRTGTIDGQRVEAQLHHIVRDQNLAQLSFDLTSSADGVTVGTSLSDGNAARVDVGSDTADGVTLIDPRRSKVYLVASTTDYQCLCTQLADAKLARDQPLVVSATFAAPPAEVTALDVQIPGFGVVAGVPVV